MPVNEIAMSSYAVPRHHDGVLVVPRQGELPAVATENSRQLAAPDIDLNGLSLGTLRVQTQAAVIAEAIKYTGNLVEDTIQCAPVRRLIVTGHQPELFHAGVWAKNFAAAGLARQTGGPALNLMIDNDTVVSTRIRLPAGTRDAPTIESIPFDIAQPQQPWEEATIADQECFQGFGERVRSRIRDCWNYEPLVSVGWPAAIRQARVSTRLCDCLAAARVAVERLHGVHNLEVPMSRVCSTRAFCQFAAFLLAHLPRFHLIYNESVLDYRHSRRMRSTTHPVPELDTRDEWLEAPFWVWRPGSRRRERPFVRQRNSEMELRDDRGVFARLPLSPDHPLDGAAAVLEQLSEHGIRFRTRALTTTMFARVFLADLFIHGIGGAKYDSMTDRICERFLGIRPPQFATVTATVHLPLGAPFAATDDELRDAGQRIREIRYNPDRYLSGISNDRIRSLITEKQGLISGLDSRRPTRVEHRRLTTIHAELLATLDGRIQLLNSIRDQLRRELKANAVLQNREFSWCLQPEEMLTSLFRREFLT